MLAAFARHVMASGLYASSKRTWVCGSARRRPANFCRRQSRRDGLRKFQSQTIPSSLTDWAAPRCPRTRSGGSGGRPGTPWPMTLWRRRRAARLPLQSEILSWKPSCIAACGERPCSPRSALDGIDEPRIVRVGAVGNCELDDGGRVGRSCRATQIGHEEGNLRDRGGLPGVHHEGTREVVRSADGLIELEADNRFDRYAGRAVSWESRLDVELRCGRRPQHTDAE